MPTKIVKYTGETEETITDGSGAILVSVGPDDRLEQTSADLADFLVAEKPDYEYYNGTKTVTNEDFSTVDGRHIEPDRVTADRADLLGDISAFSDPSSGVALGIDSNGDIAQLKPNGTVTSLPGGGGGGTAVALDLGDDGTDESSALTGLATANDTNSIATEPATDKLLLDMSANWPTADTVPNGAIGEPELNLTITPSWTGEHTFGAGWVLGDEGTDPTTAGEATRNGTDVKVYSGGSARNLSNIGSGGSGAWTSEPDDGASLPAQDLSTVAGSDGVMYHHDGSSSITANGATTSAPGYYVWSASDAEWKTAVAY